MSGETNSSSTEVSKETSVVSEPMGHIAVKHLPFYHKSPDVWFMQMESQFELANVKNSRTKYHHILAALPVDIACTLSITNSGDYDSLKQKVLNSLKENKHSLIEKALSAVELGDRRPTQIVSEIKRRFEEIGLPVDDNIVKSRLLSAVPCHIKSALVGHDNASLDQYAAIADSMLAVAGHSNSSFVGAVGASAQSQRYNNSNSSNNNNRGRDMSNRGNSSQKSYVPRPFYDGQRPRVCNSHIYWGNRARNCRTWCQWPAKPNHILKDGERTPRNSRPASPENL